MNRLTPCFIALLVLVFFYGVFPGAVARAEEQDACIACHKKVTPGYVRDWQTSMHAENGISCFICHGEDHHSAADVDRVRLPDEQVCGTCHETQYEQFKKGKHNHGWQTLNALPVTHVEPDELMEGARGCGGCHNMGIKSDADKLALAKKGFRYQNNSCDECHTRHSFSKAEARDPRACQQCHMGYDHPQWEMWSSAKHGTRWFTRDSGHLPEDAVAPRCQDCHLPNGTHTNRTAWGFFGVRLPLPDDPQWAKDRIVILKALGALSPETGKPTKRMETMKSLDMIRMTDADWRKERKKMIAVCSRCHSGAYARQQLDMGDRLIKKADHLLAEAIETVAALYKDGVLKKPDAYAFAYPDFWYFLRTGGGDIQQAAHIEQILFQMYMKHRMRAYQGCYHLNPDYAYWYGWAMMTQDYAEIKEAARLLRKAHGGGTHN